MPRASVVHFLGDPERVSGDTTLRALERIRTSLPVVDPAPFPKQDPDSRVIPPGPERSPRSSFPGPLPGGRGETYAEALDRMAEFYANPNSKKPRRTETP